MRESLTDCIEDNIRGDNAGHSSRTHTGNTHRLTGEKVMETFAQIGVVRVVIEPQDGYSPLSVQEDTELMHCHESACRVASYESRTGEVEGMTVTHRPLRGRMSCRRREPRCMPYAVDMKVLKCEGTRKQMRRWTRRLVTARKKTLWKENFRRS